MVRIGDWLLDCDVNGFASPVAGMRGHPYEEGEEQAEDNGYLAL